MVSWTPSLSLFETKMRENSKGRSNHARNVMKLMGLFPLLSLLLVLTAMVSLTLGKYPVPLKDTVWYFVLRLFGIGNIDPEYYRLLGSLFTDIRLPRIMAATLIGASLSVSGATFQAMFEDAFKGMKS